MYNRDYYDVNALSYQQLPKIQKWYRSYKYDILTCTNWITGNVRYDARMGEFDFMPEKRIK